MRNNNFILFFLTSKAAADPSFLRSRMLLPCSQYDVSECRQYENRCEVIQVSGEKNYCADVYYYERCPDFDNEADCWDHYPNCVWGGNQNGCEDRSTATRSSKLCKNNNECEVDKICMKLHFSSDQCLDDTLGQCILRPNDCPSTNEQVCSCDGKTYRNQCECLEAGMSVKYGESCSDSRDRDFRRYVRDLDDPGEYTDELLWRYMYSSVSTDGYTCLTEQECKKQSLDIDQLRRFIVEEKNPYNCGCYELEGVAYWSDHNKCSDEKKRAVSLQGTRERIHCDLNRIYRDVRNVPINTCLQASECDHQCYHDNRFKVVIKTDPNSDVCGCYRKGNQCYYNSCGDNIDKASESLPGSYSRVWCEDRDRDVRDLVHHTCLTQDQCEKQGAINGVKTSAIVKDFGSDHICGCYEKGGALYWATCDTGGDFYGELDNQKTRIHCEDVETQSRSYRVFDQEHSHLHTHPYYAHDHYYGYNPI